VVHLEAHFGGGFYWARLVGKVIAWKQFASVLQRQPDCRCERRLAVGVCPDGLPHLAIVRRQRSGWEVVQELEGEMVQRS